MVLVYSPPQSGMFVHGTPLKVCGEFIKYVQIILENKKNMSKKDVKKVTNFVRIPQ